MHFPFFRVWLHRFHDAAYRRFPRFVSDPDFDRRLAIHRRGDAEDNAQVALPEDQIVQLNCFWAVEYYFPSHIDRLLHALGKLGWDRDDDALTTGNVARWLQRITASVGRGAWMNLGRIDQPGNKSHFGRARIAPLPGEVDHAAGMLYSIAPSIYCIVIVFVLEDEAAGRYGSILRQTYQTQMIPRNRGYSIVDPYRQKLKSIGETRQQWRNRLAGWYRANLPGFFSAGDVAEFPVCEFLTLTRGRPFPSKENQSGVREQYLMALDIENDIHAWKNKDIPGLKLAWPLMHDNFRGPHAVIAAREDDFDEERLRGYGGTNRAAITAYLDTHVNALLGRWALLPVLSAFEHRFSAIQDASTVQPSSTAKPLKRLLRFGELVSQSVEPGAVAKELERFAGSRNSFSREIEEFTPCRPEFHGKQEVTLAQVLADNVAKRSSGIARHSEALRTLLTQHGTVLEAIENIRLQRKITRLTVIIAILTLVLVIDVVRETAIWKGILGYLT